MSRQQRLALVEIMFDRVRVYMCVADRESTVEWDGVRVGMDGKL